MTRLSGIQLLAVSIVLWGLAVWLFSAPHPAETDTAAATGTAARATGEKAEEPGAGAGESTVAEATTTPAAGSPNPDPGAGDSPLRDAPKHTGIATAAAPATADASATPRADVRTPPATVGDRSHIAPAPAPTGTAPAAIGPMTPGDSATGSPPGSMGRPEVPPGAARPHPWFEHPLSLPPPPAQRDFSAGDGDPVAGQINAARRAAWEGRYTDALSHYRAAARLRPNHYVVWGEMGNVLWTMGRWPEAAYALEGAATLLVRAGELRAASELVPAVGRIDPDAAYRVQRLLWATAERQSG